MKTNIYLQHLLSFVLVAGLITFPAIDTNAAFGDPDLNFGYDGDSTDWALDYEPSAMARQNDGKIVVVGKRLDPYFSVWELVVRRYLVNGSVDTAFGSYGSAVPYVISGKGVDVAIQPDGKIAVVGIAPNRTIQTAVWRFNSNGSYDSTFGNFGRVLTWGEGDCEIATYLPPGRLSKTELIVGCYGGELFRLTNNGTPNPAFGNGGIVTTSSVSSLTVKSGYIYSVGGHSITKLSLNGVLDPNFGNGGVFSQQADYSCLGGHIYPNGIQYHKVAVRNDGTIIIAGSVAFNGVISNAAASHLSAHLPNGNFEGTFTPSPCPYGTAAFSAYGSAPQHLQFDSSNRLIIGQSKVVASFPASVVRRLLPNGTDSSNEYYDLDDQFLIDMIVLPGGQILTLNQIGIYQPPIRARLNQRLP